VLARGGEAERAVLITGVLGGLGATAARLLLQRGRTVVGLDSFDPGADPEAAKHHRLSLLEPHERFFFAAADLRAGDLPRLLELAGAEKGRPVHLLLAHLPGVLRRGEVLEEVLEEVVVTAPAALARQVAEEGGATLAAVDEVFAGRGDPRAGTALWRILLEREGELADRLSELPGARALPLPALAGPLQSVRTPPLRTLSELVSRVPVRLPAAPGPLRLAPLEQAAALLVEILGGETVVATPDVAESALSPLALLDWLTERTGLRPVTLLDDLPPWGPPAVEPVQPREEDDEGAAVPPWMEDALEQWQHLPWLPPTDWPKQAARRKRRRR
jgi:hypothetical protein